MQTATSLDGGQGVRQVEIGPERDGQRVDNALMTLLKGVPRSLVYRLLRTGQVRINVFREAMPRDAGAYL